LHAAAGVEPPHYFRAVRGAWIRTPVKPGLGSGVPRTSGNCSNIPSERGASDLAHLDGHAAARGAVFPMTAFPNGGIRRGRTICGEVVLCQINSESGFAYRTNTRGSEIYARSLVRIAIE
jgi:hypothetical protein